jgi:hypothetical protein
MKMRVTGLKELYNDLSYVAANIPRTVEKTLNSEASKFIKEAQKGEDFPDLAESTKKRKRKRYGTAYPILKASGQLFAEMRAKITGVIKKRLKIYFISERSTRLAQIHADGNSKLPARNLMEFSGRHINRFWRNIAKGIFDLMRKRNL